MKNLSASEPHGKYEIRREAGMLYMKNATMANVAGVMASPLGNMPMEKVIDDTSISGRYDLTLAFKDFNPKDPEFHNYIQVKAALFDFASRALEAAYGLKLERLKLPVDFLIIDSGNKIPKQN